MADAVTCCSCSFDSRCTLEPHRSRTVHPGMGTHRREWGGVGGAGLKGGLSGGEGGQGECCSVKWGRTRYKNDPGGGYKLPASKELTVRKLEPPGNKGLFETVGRRLQMPTLVHKHGVFRCHLKIHAGRRCGLVNSQGGQDNADYGRALPHHPGTGPSSWTVRCGCLVWTFHLATVAMGSVGLLQWAA